MYKSQTVPRDVPLEGAALDKHLRAIASDYRSGGRARLGGIGRATRSLEISLGILRARHDFDELTPAAHWLVDNARMLEEACITLDEALRHAPVLPAKRGEARVNRLAREWLSHTDAQADGESLRQAAASWQAVQPLEERELTFLPLAVRRTLLLLLADLAAHSAETERERTHAEATLNITAKKRPDAYWEHLSRLLQEQEDADALSRLDHQLSELGVTADEIAQREHERQTRDCLWTGNAIASLRTLSALEWRVHLESLSSIDHWLRRDPTGVYPRMDFASRAIYRNRAVKLAAQFHLSEPVVARKAIACAENAKDSDSPELTRHVGYYLMDRGQPKLWKALGKAPLTLRTARTAGKHAATLYIAAITLGSLGTTALLWLLGIDHWLVFFALLAAGEGFRHLSGLLIHWLSPPRQMVRLAPDQLDEGQVVVVVPTLLTSPAQALEMVRHLSILRLANPESRLSYMLLADFRDSHMASEPDDVKITEAALSGMQALNDVWNGGFYYLHRERAWHEQSGRYIGHERKRGALTALNALLLTGECGDSFVTASHAPETLKGKFDLVITLDSDTKLPPGTALELAGMIQHPLNRPCEAFGKRRGCAVIQPRMEVAASTIHTRVARIWGGDGGFDPYITAFSDTYQNLCGEGSFAGKGIYNVRAFDEALSGKIRDNTILSHDLLEGGLAGSSLACDVALYDGNPSTVAGWMKRLHRWTRGDWQLLPWMIPFVRMQKGWEKNPLSALNQFKIYDNLRRSLVPVASLILIVGGVWESSPIAVLVGLLMPHIRSLIPFSLKSLRSAATDLALLPMQAIITLDAAARTLWRVLFSHKHLLEWVPSADEERLRAKNASLRFWPNFSAAALLLIASIHNPIWFLFSAPLTIVWALIPWVCKWLDSPEATGTPLTEGQRAFLLDAARRTFRFFEETVGESTNYLPPDNLQVEPWQGIAPRTSPTNIGMYLLSCVSACELGVIDLNIMARHIENTTDTLEQMEKWNGHLYNWYDIKTLEPLAHRYISSVDAGNLVACLLLTAQAMRARLSDLDERLVSLPERLDTLAAGMDFGPLYDTSCDLFYIGINAETGSASNSHYDLLASEARLLSYIALMRREVPIKHWRRMGRAMTKTRRGASLLSWSGTMFEYLLPTLFLKSPNGTLLGDTCVHAVHEQMDTFTDAPWGISESGYYAFDPTLAYQYKAFGISRLALRTARTEQVISPYASALALQLFPKETCANLQRMAEMGWLDRLGFFEAADYNPERVPEGREYVLVRSHMAHHQGMLLASICNLLSGSVLTDYFQSLPQAQAYSLLLEERTPTKAMLRGSAKTRRNEFIRRETGTLLRHVNTLEFPPEALTLYGSGTTMVCDARGGGFISHNGLLLTRRRANPFYDGGMQIYLRFADGDVARINRQSDVWFDRSHAKYKYETDGLEAELTCFVSPLDGAALHLLRMHASPTHDVAVEVASFFEICLSTQAADESHPTFRNLSVETSRLTKAAGIARRRCVNSKESYPLLLHAIGMETEKEPQAQLETSRPAFLGRGERLDKPLALEKDFDERQGETGVVLDPCMSLRMPVRIDAGSSVHIWYVTAAVPDLEKANALASQYTTFDHVLRSLELSATQDEVTARYLGLDWLAQLSAHRLASWLLTPMAQKDGPREGRQALWPFAISGDLPVIAVTISRESQLPLVRSVIKAHAYLRALGLWSDLALLNTQPDGYFRPLHEAMQSQLAGSPSRNLIGQGAGVHIIDAQSHEKQAVQALLSHAAFVLSGDEGSLTSQVAAKRRVLSTNAAFWQSQQSLKHPLPLRAGSLALDNGFGGFRADGGYIIHGGTPAPWCNVLANPQFGTIVTERGAGFTWCGNSRMRRITAFASDPVRDQRTECLWLRDETDGHFVSPYDNALVTHGFGFSRFESEALGLRLTLDVFVDETLLVKCILLGVENPQNERRRTLTVTASVQWLLGSLSQDSAQVRCEASDGVAYAQSPAFDMPVFLTTPGRKASVSCDGAAFIGGGSMMDPAGMHAKQLVNAFTDVPFGIVRTELTLHENSTETICIILGTGDFDAAIHAYRGGGAQVRLARVREAWQQRQQALTPRLPNAAMSILAGCWFPYQALSSRVFAHAGFYQAGGAIGFRDQLQDMLAFRFTNPAMIRAHILDAAAHQFEDGDVQHWWHPPALGVRTRITDDRLFLPYVTAAYLRATEDTSILSENIPYLESVEIPEGHEDWYGQAQQSEKCETLHQHNLRAIESIRYGAHGIPLIGTGDWNDGMNAVGARGKGESVWLGFFLAHVLREYSEFCAPAEADALQVIRQSLMENLETHAWDGEWYLRAWTDDGVPLGGKDSPECRIDLVAQAWAVLSGAAQCGQALDSAAARLWDKEAGILKLMDPPFDGASEPGYIRAYPPGIRENGGQYTHAAAWFVMACAKAGKTALAWELFEMLLPTSHSGDKASAIYYRVEPYVVAADVSAGTHPGRGGWTWYTGSASLLYTVCLESLLGFEKSGNRIRLRPTAPAHWNGYVVEYRYGSTTYRLRAERDGENTGWIELVDDGGTHEVIFALKS